jgi:hypothetical protein
VHGANSLFRRSGGGEILAALDQAFGKFHHTLGMEPERNRLREWPRKNGESMMPVTVSDPAWIRARKSHRDMAASAAIVAATTAQGYVHGHALSEHP